MAERKQKPIPKTTTGKKPNFRKTKKGAGMTKAGVAAHRRANPGSKLKTAVIVLNKISTSSRKFQFSMYVSWPRHNCVLAKTQLCSGQDVIVSWPRNHCVVAKT